MSVGTHTVLVYPPAVQQWSRVPMANDDFSGGLTNWARPDGFTIPWTVGSGVVSAPTGTPSPAQQIVGLQQIISTPRGAVKRWRIELDFTATSQTISPAITLGLSRTAVPPTTGNKLTTANFASMRGGSYTLGAEYDISGAGYTPDWAYVFIELTGFSASSQPGVFTVDAVRLYQPTAAVDISCLVDEVSIQHGRDDTTAQPEASAATLTLDLRDTVLPATVDIGSDVVVTTTVADTTSTRFRGRITDLALGFDDVGELTPVAGQGQIAAVGYLADLGRRVVGDAPFPQELDGARVQRILTLAGFTPSALTSDPGTVQVLARDIDARSALEVAQDTAQSASGLVWQTRASDVRYADAAHRRGIPSSLTLDACDVLVTPTWSRSLQGLINKVTISYGLAPDGGEQPTTGGQAAASITRYGTYDYSLTSELATLADAQSMAGLLLARNSSPVWVMSALPVDLKGLSDAETADVLGLEMHALVMLTGMPVVSPNVPTSAALWVEGWSERLSWDAHDIELHVSGYCRTVPAPRWDDVDNTITWDTAAMTWDESACFGPPVLTDRWTDVPASTRWDTAVGTWDAYTGGSL